MEVKKVLVVDNDIRDTELVLSVFKTYNFSNEVLVFEDGSTVFKYLTEQKQLFSQKTPYTLPLVIFLDLKMPKMGGEELLSIIKKDPILKTIPVVILSSSGEAPDIARCYELGANAYVVKPVSFELFTKRIEAMCLFWIFANQTATLPVKTDGASLK